MAQQFDKCILCGSSYSPLRHYEADHLVKCHTCHLIFSQKIPTYQELLDCYSLYPRSNEISPITLKRCNQLLDGFEKYRKTNRIIDVGAGDGWFLFEAKKRGWEVYGTEFEDRAIELCIDKGIQMKKGILDPLSYDNQLFDIITSFEVVEHINNPREEFVNFYRILRPGGLVYVTTPNFNSISRNILKDKWHIFHYPEHLTYYTPRTLSYAFNKGGLAAHRIITSGFSYSGYKIDRAKGMSEAVHPYNVSQSGGITGRPSDDERIRDITENRAAGRLAKFVINEGLNFFGKGDSIKAMFIKEP